MTSVDDVLKTARLPERTVPVCLRGDLVAELDALQTKLTEAETAAKTAPSDDRMVPADDPTVDIRNAIDAVRAEMRADVVEFRIRALNPDEMDELILAHPVPAEGATDTDEAVGFHWAAVRQATLRRALTNPVIDGDDDYAKLRRVVSHGQWQDLVNEAWQLASAKVDVAFLRAG